MRTLLFIFIFSFLLYLFGLIRLLVLKKWRSLTLLVIIPILTLCFCSILFYVNSSNYPSEWNDNLLSKKRKVVHQELGATRFDALWDIKSDVWFDDHLFSSHRLDIIYDKTDSTAGAYTIQYYVGVYGIFKKFNIKASNQP